MDIVKATSTPQNPWSLQDAAPQQMQWPRASDPLSRHHTERDSALQTRLNGMPRSLLAMRALSHPTPWC